MSTSKIQKSIMIGGIPSTPQLFDIAICIFLNMLQIIIKTKTLQIIINTDQVRTICYTSNKKYQLGFEMYEDLCSLSWLQKKLSFLHQTILYLCIYVFRQHLIQLLTLAISLPCFCQQSSMSCPLFPANPTKRSWYQVL